MTDVRPAQRGKLPLYLIILGLLALAGVGYLVWTQYLNRTPVSALRVSVPPFVDTAFTQVGLEKGAFGDLGPRMRLVNTTWENQYEMLAGGGLDISMSTIDEFVNKSRNLRAAGKPIVFILPAWKFRGLGFYTAGEMQPLAASASTDDRTRFLKQFEGRKIVLPEGSVFEQALRSFVRGTGIHYEDLQIVNAPLESALNSLSDRSVGIVAVGSQQRFEAERRGFREAISPEALGLDVITGFVAPESVYRQRRNDVIAFACGWFATARLVTDDQQGAYRTTNGYLVQRGASSLTFEEYSALRAYNVVPTSPAAASALFLAPNGAANWQRVWARSVAAMNEAGKTADAPQGQQGFVAGEVIAAATDGCS